MQQPPQRSSQQQFGATAANYVTSAAHRTGDSLRLVEEAFAKEGRRFATAVDIATGPGFTAFAAVPFADTVLATDLTREMLTQVTRVAKEREIEGVERALVAAESLPFRDASIDLLTCRTAAHHFLDPDAWLAEVTRVLEPRGVFVFCDTVSPEDEAIAEWMNEVEERRDPSHVRNRSPIGWQRSVEAAGMRVTDTAMTRVLLEFADWCARAHVSEEETRALEVDFRAVGPSHVAAFAMERDDDTIRWGWDVLVLRAEKP